MMTSTKDLSSLERLLLGIDQPEIAEVIVPLRRGQLCPICSNANLDYNGLLQLACSACDFAENGEGAGCT